jgi:hypothetical protein
MRRHGLLVFALGSAACSLLVPLSSDELSRGGDAGVAVTIDGAPTDASDAGKPPGDGAPRSCDATFCDDFDNGPLGATWTATDTAKGGELTLVPQAFSPPNALRMFIPDTSGTRTARLAKAFPTPKRVRCDVELFITKPPVANQNVQVLGFNAPTDAEGFYAVFLKIEDASGYLAEEVTGSPDRVLDLPPFPVGSWVHFAMDVDLAASKVELIVGARSTAFTLVPVALGPTLTVIVGEPSESQGGAFEASFDDFSCNLTP